jgi:hypothetical protein
MTLTRQHLVAILIALCLTIVAFFLFNNVKPAFGATPAGIPATIATTSVEAVTTSQLLVFATSTCTARTISTTGADGIRITFTDGALGALQGFQPSGSQGFWQAASTTVTYDATQYGCGALRIFSGTPQTITVSESR